MLANTTAKHHLAILNQGKHIGDRITQIGDRTLSDLLEAPPTGLWHSIEYLGHKFELIAKPMDTYNRSDGWVIVTRDVTEEWRIEQSIQQQERLASVGQLAAGIAHDFNNILAVITLYSDLTLLDTQLRPKTRKHFEIVKTQSLRATELNRQILDFSRRSVMEQIDMNLIPFIKELVKLFKRTLPENITTTLKSGHGNYFVKGDPARLQQVFMNLVFNARDAMPKGGEILISLKRIQLSKDETAPHPELARRLLENGSPKEWICISVQDNGTGIEADVRQHIFEPFFTTKEVGKGSGMGLSQVFGIIKQHDGEIDVRTEPGEGSEFLIYLPALAIKTPSVTPTKLSDFPHGNQETILVVEDNPNMQQVVITSLEELNYKTLSARNGEEALALLEEKEEDIDLILSDLIMPRMGGKNLLQTIRDEGNSTQVIIMTGHPLHEEKEEILALGVAGWLDKPPSLAEMAKVIAQVLNA
jgi:signal transduction histidine kinase